MPILTLEQRKKAQELLEQSKQIAGRLESLKGTLTKEELEKPLSPQILSITPPPSPTTRGSNLVEFANVLEQINELANRKRQRLTLETLTGEGFVPGAVEPGTFASILKNVELASRRGVEESLETAKEVVGKEPELTGSIKEFQDAKRLKLIEEDTDYFEFLKKVGEAKREGETVSDINNPLDLSDSEIKKGMFAAGDLVKEDFLKRSIREQQDFVFGEKAELVRGKPEKKSASDLQKIKESFEEAIKNEEIDREEAEARIERNKLNPVDELELLLFLDEIAPPKATFFEGFKGLF